MTPGPAAPDPPTRLPLIRWAALSFLLLAEFGVLSAAYDAADRGNDPGWAGPVVAWTPAVFRWALVAGGLAVALGLWFRRGELLAAVRTPYPPARLALAVVAHLSAYGLFALATRRVMGTADPLGAGALIAWLAAGGLTVATWALAMIPPAAWPTLVWRGRRLWPLAGAIAAVASLVARAIRNEWDLLSEPSMRAAHGLLRFVLPGVQYDAELKVLGTDRFWVEVGVPCSGYEGLGLMAVYLAVYLTLFRRDLRFPRAFLLIPLALAAVWLANVVRLAALVWIGDQLSPTLAIGGFHSQAGWIGFNAVALMLLVLAHRSRLFTRNDTRRATGPDPTAAYLAPLLAAVLVQMLAAALSPRPELLYPVRALVAGLLLAYYWPRYTALRSPGRGPAWAGLAWAGAVGVGVFAVWVALVKDEKPLAPATELSGGEAIGWVVAKVLGFVVVTPLAEELAFRGYLMRRLISADFEAVEPGRFTWVSFVVSSVLFGLMHGQWLAGVLAGAGYGLVVVRTGRVRDAVVAHGLTNWLLLLPTVV